MGWSLLGVSEEFDPLKSVDLPSVILARILYAGFLIMGVILLINMLIALLSNTYQRIEVKHCDILKINHRYVEIWNFFPMLFRCFILQDRGIGRGSPGCLGLLLGLKKPNK